MSGATASGIGLVRLARPDDAEGWRQAARERLVAGVPPEAIVWEAGEPTADLFGGIAFDGDASGDEVPASHGVALEPPATPPRVPRSFVELAERVVCHTDPDRFGLLYRVLWRLTRGEPDLLARASDPDMHRLHVLGKRVSRERHKMHAFVRFRQTPGVEPEHFGAWFEPELHTLRLSSGFFVRRFANMRWSIVTPEESVHWDTRALTFGPGGTRGDLPETEAMEALWRTYFANIFNPARLRLDAMRSEMPVKYWKNLPEAPLIAELIHAAGNRTSAMIEAAPSVPPRYAAGATHPATGAYALDPADPRSGNRLVPAPGGAGDDAAGDAMPAPRRYDTLASLHAATRSCTACEHACRATTAVNGEGPAQALLMLVGEQAGDREDLAGRPFVGPAGSLLRGVLEDLGVDPATVFLTNAVRHFRHEPRGKRRLHRTPTTEHVGKCRTFLFEEIRLVRPRVIVALGATAGLALLGRPLRVNAERGLALPFGDGRVVIPTAHPASVLRTPDEPARLAAHAALRADLAFAQVRLAG